MIGSRGVFVFAILFAFVNVTTARAAVLTVPGQYSSIGQALAAAGRGDTIFVAPGTYREMITWPAVDGIRLIATQGAGVTTIDAGQQGSVVTFATGLTRDTVLHGFTITGGALQSGRSRGAGIFCPSSPIIEACVIRNNTASGPLLSFGGGIFVDRGGSPTLIRNVIRENVVTDGSWVNGAGIYLADGSGARIVQNEIVENEGRMSNTACGAGVYISRDCWYVLAANIIARNQNLATTFNYGGGVYCNSAGQMLNNTIADNQCNATLSSRGGGVYYSGDAPVLLANNLVIRNSAAVGGGAYRDRFMSGDLLAYRNNVWQNAGGNYANVVPRGDSVSTDPLLTSAYRLTPRSPMIDAGDSTLVPTNVATDVEGDPRVLDGDFGVSAPRANVDIGADEYANVRLLPKGVPKIGAVVDVFVSAPSGDSWMAFLALQKGGGIVHPFGNLLIGPPYVLFATGSGPGLIPVKVPLASSLAGTSLYFQALATRWSGGRVLGNLSNRVAFLLFQ